MKRKALSILLAIAICLTFVPLLPGNYANADEDTVTIASASDLANYITDCGLKCQVEGTTVKLADDLYSQKELDFTNDKDNPITIDLNGHTMTNYDYCYFVNESLIYKTGNGQLNIMDSSRTEDDTQPVGNVRGASINAIYSKAGTINISDSYIRSDNSTTDYSSAGIFLAGEQTVTIKDSFIGSTTRPTILTAGGVELSVKGSCIFINPYYGLKASGNNNNITIENCKFDSEEAKGGGIHCASQTTNITVKNTIVNAYTYEAVFCQWGNMILDGGKFVTDKRYEDGVGVFNDSTMVIKGGAYIKGDEALFIGKNYSEDPDATDPKVTLGECTLQAGDYCYYPLMFPADMEIAQLLGPCSSGIDEVVHPEYYDYGETYVVEDRWAVKAEKVEIVANHTPGEWIVDLAPTATTPGKQHSMCTVCGDVAEERPIDITLQAPTNVKVVLTTNFSKASGYHDVKFSWNKVPEATGYYVAYKKDQWENYINLGYTKDNFLFKKKLADGTKYTFKVTPIFESKDGITRPGVKSSTASIWTLKKLDAPTITKSGTKVNVKWKNIEGETGYQISKSTKKTGTSIVATYATTKGTSKLVAATKGKTYYYKVRAYKTVGGVKIYGPWSSAKAFKRK